MNSNSIISEDVTDIKTDDASAEISADDGDTSAAEIAKNPAEEEIITPEYVKSLKEELAALKGKLEENRTLYEKLHAECAEFSELYPDVPISALPDDIWKSFRAGIPVAAAYALYEKKEAVARAKAESINSKNKDLSSGSLGTSKSEEFFSPAEVKAMSPAEVRANYTKIINSMSRWH